MLIFLVENRQSSYGKTSGGCFQKGRVFFFFEGFLIFFLIFIEVFQVVFQNLKYFTLGLNRVSSFQAQGKLFLFFWFLSIKI